MLGLPKGIVKLEPHSENWRQLFAEEAAAIRRAIGEIDATIEHVGSTSIGGMAAKPIIDVAIGLKNLADGEQCVAPLEKVGYEYRGEHGIAERFYFVKGEPRTHHLHVVERGGDLWRNHLLFRDYLRNNRAVAATYERLKIDLAEKYPANRDAYLQGKNDFIENILRRARLESPI